MCFGLAGGVGRDYFLSMTDKQLVMDMLARLPEGASLEEIVTKIRFIAGVQEGLGQLDCGEGVPVETVEKMIAAWTGSDLRLS